MTRAIVVASVPLLAAAVLTVAGARLGYFALATHGFVPAWLTLICIAPLALRGAGSLRRRMLLAHWELHGVLGAVSSALLCVIFWGGVAALFREAIGTWLEPQLQRMALPAYDVIIPGLETLGVRCSDALIKIKMHGSLARVALGDDVYWVDATGKAIRASSVIANELYKLHYFDQVPGGMAIAGVVAVALLVITVSGLVLQARRLGRDLWRMRAGNGLRLWSSDAHKALGLFGLPFVTLMAWSGSILTLEVFIQRAAAVGGSTELMEYMAPEPRAAEAPYPQLSAIVTRAQQMFAITSPPKHFMVRGGRVAITFDEDGFGTPESIEADADGIRRTTRATAASALTQALFALHFGRYAGYLLKCLYAVLAIAVIVVVVSGNVIWILRRDPSLMRPLGRLLLGVTLGNALGLPLAAAGCILASRWVFVDAPERALAERIAFYVGWALLTALAIVVAARWGRRPPCHELRRERLPNAPMRLR